ncbi:MAG: Ig-like domain-containing protein [Paracoccaceae bacterium]
MTPIAAGAGQEISLNLRQSDIQGYQRLGNNLQITLMDGRVVMLEDFFGATGENARLFISADGYLNEVDLVQGADGAVFATYGPTEQWGKWSPSDDLIFLDGTEVAVAGPAADEDVTMLGAGLLNGLGGLGLLGAGAAAAGAAVVFGGGDGGSAGNPRTPPTVDQDGVITIGGDDVTDGDQSIVISGTAEPGSEVVVTIGDQVLTTTSDEDGVWEVDFTGEHFPIDGEYPVDVVVTEDDGTITELDGPDVVIDLTPPDIAFDDGVESIGDFTNAADHVDGVEIGGTGEPGATVEVTVEGVTHTTTVAEDGSWGVVFTPEELPGGEYETGVTVVTTDGYGNSTTVTDTVIIDTVVNVGIDAGQAGGDDLINGAEQAAGVTLTGTADEGSTVVVTLAGVSHTVTAGADGTWSVDFASAEIPTGETEATVTAVATDVHGNSTSTETVIQIDTVNTVTFDAAGVEGDGMVNAAEHADGVTFSGTTQAGSTVVVTANGVSHTVTAGSDGTWSVDFASSELPTGETELTVDVSSTDAVGNVATTSGTVQIDTLNSVTFDADTVEGDGLVNAAEHADGVTFTGTTQPGSTVVVEANGVSHTVTANASGQWSVDFASGELPEGELDLPVNVTSTDPAGNEAATSGTVHIDTLNGVTFNASTVEGDGMVNAAERADGVTLTGTTDPGSSVSVQVNGATYAATVDAAGNWSLNLSPAQVPQGETSMLVNVTATDAVGNVSTTSGTVMVDTVNSVTLNTAGIEGDGIVNGVERADGVTLTGTTQPGSEVSVLVGGATYAATVDASGNWTLELAPGQVPEGETTMPVSVTSVDAAGNVATTNGSVEIDTYVRDFALTGTGGGVDGVVNDAESASGVTLTGTVEPGSSVVVDVAGVSYTATVAANGAWSVNLPASAIPDGDLSLPVTATATDAAGNTDVVTGSVEIDTIVENLGFTNMPLEGDNVVNGAERGDGVTVTGTVEVGSTVMVTLAGTTQAATVDASGNWTVTYPAGSIPEGEYDSSVQVDVVDSHGNTDSLTQAVRVDTFVNELTSTAPVEGDNVVNAEEAQDGFTLTGTVEAGSVVEVEFNGTTYSATVASNGAWSVDIPAAGIPVAEVTATALITATDAAGNTDSMTREIEIDTVLPEAPDVASYTRDHTGIRGISIETVQDDISLHHVHADGSITDIASDGTDIPLMGETIYGFTPTVPNGSHLVVSAEDAAGNLTSTYLVLDDTSTSVVDMANPNLGALNIETIDLQFAEDSQLTITEDQLLALSGNSDQVLIQGGGDDTVTAMGAVDTHTTQVIDGHTYATYTMGDSGTLLIEEHINVVI